jgi:hypothetical protein
MRTKNEGKDAQRRLLARLAWLSGLSCLAVMAVASPASAQIVVGVGIDGVKLGQTEAQVRQALGAPGYTMPATSGGESSWGYPKTLEGRVGFKAGKVVAMWTIAKHQKTSKGIGPGASLAKVKRAYPKAKCSTGPFGPKSLICVLKSKYQGRAAETSFPFFYRTAGLREVDVNFA